MAPLIHLSQADTFLFSFEQYPHVASQWGALPGLHDPKGMGVLCTRPCAYSFLSVMELHWEA